MYEGFFGGILKEQDLFESPRLRVEDTIKININTKEFEVVDYINLAQSRNHFQTVLITVIALRVPQNFMNV
jgi:hypothetical protein